MKQTRQEVMLSNRDKFKLPKMVKNGRDRFVAMLQFIFPGRYDEQGQEIA